ncbi:MAG: ABC transporter permease [Actinobacteria bacterium]|nr:ABC transporter permease [Actinomycetota bacterium]
MARQVPLARRNLWSEPRRLVASVAGVGLALMLILLLDGLWAGIDAKTTVYEDQAGADLYVVSPGTKSFFSAASVLPASTVDQVRSDPEVKWAAPVRGLFSIMQLHESKVPAYLIGWQPGQPGGPSSVIEGRAPARDNEITIGRVLAQRHGINVGDQLDILGRSFTVVGLADADMFMTSFVFMTHAATDQALRAPGTTSFVLVGTDRPQEVRARLASTGLTVLDRGELKANDLSVLARPFSVPLQVMVAVAFAIGSVVIALTAYSAIIEHRRDYGIIKAVGADRWRLYRIALTQTTILATGGLLAGAAMFFAGRMLISWARPQFAIVLTPTIVGRAIAAAALMGAVAALLPARRLARLDPATAYRGG